MSLEWSLRRLVDASFQQEQAERKKQGETVPADLEGAKGPPRRRASEPEPPSSSARTYRCRVCAHEQGSPDYCPSCLADTMEPVGRGDGATSARRK